jgi:hypothetical protein
MWSFPSASAASDAAAADRASPAGAATPSISSAGASILNPFGSSAFLATDAAHSFGAASPAAAAAPASRANGCDNPFGSSDPFPAAAVVHTNSLNPFALAAVTVTPAALSSAQGANDASAFSWNSAFLDALPAASVTSTSVVAASASASKLEPAAVATVFSLSDWSARLAKEGIAWRTTVDDVSDSDPCAAGPSAARSLYRHALESIFAFLSLKDLALGVLRTSCEWSAAVGSMKSLDFAWTEPRTSFALPLAPHKHVWTSVEMIRAVLQSPFARHIGTIGIGDCARLPLLMDALTELVEARCSSLHTLRFVQARVSLWSAAHHVFLPSRLRHLSCELVLQASLRHVLQQSARLQQLETLALTLKEHDYASENCSFVGLQSLPRLRSLELTTGALTNEQVTELRLLTASGLQRLHVDSFSRHIVQNGFVNELVVLLAPPHHPFAQLREVGLIRTDEATEQLRSLPQLTKISVSSTLQSWRFLRDLPRLVHLDLTLAVSNDPHQLDSFLAEAKSTAAASSPFCASLTSLTLRSQRRDLSVMRSHAETLVEALVRALAPRLRSLTLHRLELQGWSPQWAAAAAPSLTQLRMEDVPSFGSLAMLHPLSKLCSLALIDSVELSADERLLYERPSFLFPKLAQFEYRFRAQSR